MFFFRYRRIITSPTKTLIAANPGSMVSAARVMKEDLATAGG